MFNSTGNDGEYTVASSTYNPSTGRTSIVVVEAIPSAVADGNIRYRVSDYTASINYIVDLGYGNTISGPAQNVEVPPGIAAVLRNVRKAKLLSEQTEEE